MRASPRSRGTNGWDIGERPRVPMPYIVLPQYQFVKAHLRHEDGRYSSRPEVRDPTTRKRRDWQRREGQGWALSCTT